MVTASGRCEEIGLQGIYTYCEHRLGALEGAHADLIAAPEHCCLKLPDDVPDDVGVLLTSDGLGVPYHCGQRIETKGGDFVLVVGAGPIGLGNILVQAFRGAEVIAMDIQDERLKLARVLGARHAFNVAQIDAVTAVRDITEGEMCAATINAVGAEQGLRTCIRCTAVGGRIINVGQVGTMELNVTGDLASRDLSLIGSSFYHFHEFPEMVRLFRHGLPVGRLITHRFPLIQAARAYREFVAGATGKVILIP